ncbi:MAG: helix-turn-helix domain-containing protein [Solirubrobacterales bacterium]
MATAGASLDVGSLLRKWREQRRMTQLELALDAGISARHLSFVETGRSQPGGATVLQVAERLAIPYRERNEILLAAGYAPAFPERSLQDQALAPVRDALDRILAAHEPYPGIVFDRGWNVVTDNTGMSALIEGTDIDPSLLEPPVNVLRLGFHPRGLAPYILNFAHWRSHFLARLSQQIAVSADSQLSALLEELSRYPGGAGESGAQREIETTSEFLGPVRMRRPGGGEWSFFGMFAGFDTPFEVTTSELALELLFPADRDTQRAFTKGES